MSSADLIQYTYKLDLLDYFIVINYNPHRNMCHKCITYTIHTIVSELMGFNKYIHKITFGFVSKCQHPPIIALKRTLIIDI